MRFIVDADLPRMTAAVLQQHGCDAADVRDIGMASSSDAHIAAHARAHQLAIITGDFGFADIRNYPPEVYHGIVVLQFPNSWDADSILGLVAEFAAQRSLVDRLAGRLAIVEPGRMRIRPALSV